MMESPIGIETKPLVLNGVDCTIGLSARKEAHSLSFINSFTKWLLCTKQVHVVPPLHANLSTILAESFKGQNFKSKRVLTSFILEILLMIHVFVKHSSLVKKLFLRCFPPSCFHLYGITSKIKLNMIMQCRQ